MAHCDAAECFKSEPTDAIKLVLYQQPGIDSYFQIALIFDKMGANIFNFAANIRN